jgi:hypothetical protein
MVTMVLAYKQMPILQTVMMTVNNHNGNRVIENGTKTRPIESLNDLRRSL